MLVERDVAVPFGDAGEVLYVDVLPARHRVPAARW